MHTIRHWPSARLLLACLVVMAAGGTVRSAHAQPDAHSDATPQTVAMVNGEPVDAAEVAGALRDAFRGRIALEDASPQLRARALDQVIDRRLVSQLLSRGEHWASEGEIDAAMKTFKARAEAESLTWNAYLKRLAMSEEQLRRQTEWRMGWNAFLKRELDDEALAQHFDKHRAEFDGTQVRASHILWKNDAPRDTARIKALADEATRVRQAILAGQVDFAAAALKYSTAASRDQGGDVGYFSRHGQMHASFAAAAFALKQGEISEPVTSPFGVHLIQVTGIRPGDKKLGEVRDAVWLAAAAERFSLLASAQRQSARIKVTAGVPHFHPITGELVLPR